MTLEEAYECSSSFQFLGRNAWIKSGIIMHLISCDKTLDEIKIELDQSSESLNADDWQIFNIMD